MESPLWKVDHRERGALNAHLKEFRIPFEYHTLPVGDIEIQPPRIEIPLVIERKDITDFAMSVMDERMWHQAYRISSSFLPLVAVTGSIQSLKKKYLQRGRNYNENIIRGSIASLYVRYGLGVVHLPSNRELVRTIPFILSKIQEGKLGIPHRTRRAIRSRDKRLDTLKIIFGLTEAQAKGLLDFFGSLRQIFRVIENKPYALTDVAGIAEATVKKMRKVWSGMK